MPVAGSDSYSEWMRAHRELCEREERMDSIAPDSCFDAVVALRLSVKTQRVVCERLAKARVNPVAPASTAEKKKTETRPSQSQVPAAKSNKAIVDHYDHLVQVAQERVESAPAPRKRRSLLSLIARLNVRGLRELNRRQQESEERLWQDSLMPTTPRRNKWF